MSNIDKIIENRYPLRDAIRKLENSIIRCKDDVVLDMYYAKNELERLERDDTIDEIDVVVINSYLADLGDAFKNQCGIYQKLK